MKKTFNFSFPSPIKEQIIVEAHAYASDKEILGKLVVKRFHGNNIMAKYIPVEGVNWEKNIVEFKFDSEEQGRAKVFLENLSKKLEELLRNNPENSLVYSGVISAISPQRCAIFIPLGGFVSITNEVITKFISDKWVGSETLEEMPEFYEKMMG